MRHRFPILREWVERRARVAEQLEQAAIEGALLDCRTPEDCEVVLACLRERAQNRRVRVAP